MQTHLLCWRSPNFGACREGRHWDSAGSSRRAERVRNQQPFLSSGSGGPAEGVELCHVFGDMACWVCTCLPKAIGLAAGLFPLTFHERTKIIYQAFPSVSLLLNHQAYGQSLFFLGGRSPVFMHIRSSTCFSVCGAAISPVQLPALLYFWDIFLYYLVQDVGGILGVVDP